MGLWTALKAAASGRFSDAGNYLFVSEESLATHDEVAANQARIVQRQFDDGLLDRNTFDELNADIYSAGQGRDIYEENFRNPETSPLGGFVEGLGEGLAAEQKFFKGALGTLVRAITGFIPWWAWILLIVAAVVYFKPAFIMRRLSRP